MRVPTVVVDGDIGHTALDQSACRETGLAEFIPAIPVADGIFFLRQIEHLAGIAENQIVRFVFALDRRRQARITRQSMFECVAVPR